MSPAKRTAKQARLAEEGAATSASSAAPAAAGAAPVAVLLARCSRSALEELLEQSVLRSSVVTVDMIKGKLPEAKRAMAVERTKVADGPAREGTGFFDLLDEELLVSILAQVGSTATQLTCLIAVCKAWRLVSLCSSKEIFSSLALCGGHSILTYRPFRAMKITTPNVPRLLQFLPDVGAVHTFTLDAGGKGQSIPPDVIKKMLPQFTGLTRLTFGGKKITGAVLAIAAKQPWAQNLVSYTSMGASSGSEIGAEPIDLLPLLGQATKLAELTLPGSYSVISLLTTLAKSWREKRGGDAVPLLSTLDLTTRYGASCSWAHFRSLPTLFPELATLKFTGANVNSDDLGILGGLASWPAATQLRVLHISKLCNSFSSDGHWSTAQLGAGLRRIFAVAPNVEDLSISHGTMFLSSKDHKAGKRMEPFPGVDGALADLPSSLLTLRLGDMALAPSDLDLASLPVLKRLTLERCGFAEATALAERLLATGDCPRLDGAAVYIGNGIGRALPLSPKVAAEPEA